jgi:hypothetical protein
MSEVKLKKFTGFEGKELEYGASQQCRELVESDESELVAGATMDTRKRTL